MADFDLSMQVTADGGEVVATADKIESAIDKIDTAQRKAAGGATELETATSRSAAAALDLTSVNTRLDAVLKAIQQNTVGAAKGHAALRDAIAGQSKATGELSTSTDKMASTQAGAAASLNAVKVASVAVGTSLDGVSEASRRVAAASSAVEIAETRQAGAVAKLQLAHLKAAEAANDDAAAQLRVTGSLASAEAAVLSADQSLIASKERLAKEQANLNGLNDIGGQSNHRAKDSTDLLKFAYRDLGFQLQDVGTQLSTVSGPDGLFRIFAQQGGQIFSALALIAQGSEQASSGIGGTGEASKDAGGDVSDLGEKVGGALEKVKQTGSGFSKFAEFMSGPWGAALLIGATLLEPLIAKLFDAGHAAEDEAAALAKAAEAADTFGAAQSSLGRIFDITTGKLKSQNAVLIQTIKLQAQANVLAAQAKQGDAAATLGGIADPTLLERIAGGAAMVGSGPGAPNSAGQESAENLKSNLAPLKKVVQDYIDLTNIAGASQGALDKGLQGTLRRIDDLGKMGKLAGRDAIEAKQAVLALGQTLNAQASNSDIIKQIDQGYLDSEYINARKTKTPRTKKPKSTAATDEFGRDAADKIATIVGQFDGEPTVIEKTNKQIRQLDDLIDDLGRKKPPNFQALIDSAEAAKTIVRDGLIKQVGEAFAKPKTEADKAAVSIKALDAVIADLQDKKPPDFEKLIADANTAKGVIRDGLARPYNDFLKAQQDSLDVQKLINKGQLDQAEALKIIQGLERGNGALTDDRKAAILATVEALRAEQRETDILQEKQQRYLTAIGDIKAAVKGVIFDGTQGLLDLPGKLVTAFGNLKKDEIFDKLFGNVFRDLEDQVKGTTVVKDASERMADAIATTIAPLSRLADAVDQTAAALAGKPGGGAVAGANGLAASFGSASLGPVLSATALGALTDKVLRGEDISAPSSNVDANGDIVVKGQRPKKSLTSEELLSTSLGKLAKGVGISDEAATKIGKLGGKAIAGAATGAAVNSVLEPIGKALGIKTSSTGAQIGGAIGSFIPIPGGDIIGSIIGSVVGGLFKKPKYGTASVSSDGGTTDIGVTGNNSDIKSNATSLAGSVKQGVAAIAQQLGGALGKYDLAIGEFDGKYRVNDNATSKSLNYNNFNDSTLHNFGNDAEGAVAYAIQNAVADGAVTGLSAAVTKALKSSPDLDEALKEALKVQDVEVLIGGIGAQLDKVFSDQAAKAADRVRIAKTYGLDVLAVEKANADERTKLIADTLKASVGNLQSLLTDLTSGDLFEGSAADQRSAILAQIGTTKTKADAGEAGAADELAALYRNLLATSKDAYGTAGSEYSSDRATAQSGAAAVIKAEQDRIDKAAALQQSVVDSAKANNDLTNETNDLLAVTNNTLAGLPVAIAVALGTNSAAKGATIYTARTPVA